MLIFAQGCCIRVKVVVFGLSGCIWSRVVVFVQNCCMRARKLCSGKSGYIREKVVFGQICLYSGKVVVFGHKMLYSNKSGCIRLKWL